MFDPAKPVGECAAQELMAALMLQGGFNSFDPQQVLSDLYANSNLWVSFLMGPPLPQTRNTPIFGLLVALRDIRDRWNADMLYVFTRDDLCVPPLVELGQGWNCTTTQVIDRSRTANLLGIYPAPPPIVTFWWD